MQGKSQKTKRAEKITVSLSQKADLLTTNRSFSAATFQLASEKKKTLGFFFIANLFVFQFYHCMTEHGDGKETLIWLQKLVLEYFAITKNLFYSKNSQELLKSSKPKTQN